jgi:hypothetical protein
VSLNPVFSASMLFLPSHRNDAFYTTETNARRKNVLQEGKPTQKYPKDLAKESKSSL